MKNKKNLKSLSLDKKTISNLNLTGGIKALSEEIPETFRQGCPTDPRICDPVETVIY